MAEQQDNARTWSWPARVLDVGEVLMVARNGFTVVTTYIGQTKDRPIYALMRDGEFSPRGLVNQKAASIAVQRYFGHFMKLDDNTLIYKLKTKGAGAVEELESKLDRRSSPT